MKTITCIVATLTVFAAASWAAPAPGKPGIIEMGSKLVQLQEKLEALEKSIVPGSAGGLDLVAGASARISALRAHLEKKPKEKRAMQLFQTCSLYVEGAVLQVEQRNSKMRISALEADRDSLLNELNRVHQKITDIERRYGTKLQSDLIAEQQQVARMKEEARKIREDAEKRFLELQSALIQVRKDARGTIISMSDILFAFDKADLTGDLKTSLAKIAGILSVYKNSRIAVEGHTDNEGSKEYNKSLSERRANNVLKFLVEQGVKSSRLESRGFGETQPVATNKTKEGRQQNRRVDLVIKDDEKAAE